MKCSLWCNREIVKGVVVHDFGTKTAPPSCDSCYQLGVNLGWW